MIRDNVLYRVLGWAPQQGLWHSFGMAILRSSRLPSRHVAQWPCLILGRLSGLIQANQAEPQSLFTSK